MSDTSGPSSEIEKQFEKLRNELYARDNQTAAIESKIQSLSAKLQKEIQNSFESDTVAHRAHITSLYTKFERIIYVLVIVGIGFATYLGFEINKIPNIIDSAVEKSKTQLETSLNAEIEQAKSKLKEDFKDITDNLRGKSGKIINEMTEKNSEAVNTVSKINALETKAKTSFSSIGWLNEEAKNLQTHASTSFRSIIELNRIAINEMRTEIAILRFRNSRPRTKDEVNELIEVLRLSSTLENKTTVERLLSILINFSDINFIKENRVIATAISNLLPSDENEPLTSTLVKVGFVLEIEDIVLRVKRILSKPTTTENARSQIELLLDMLIPQVTSRLSRRQNIKKFISKKLIDELIVLADTVKYPRLARKAVELVDFEELNVKQRRDFENSLEKWAQSETLKAGRLIRVMRRLPADFTTARFLVVRFQKHDKIDDLVKKRVIDYFIDQVSTGRSDLDVGIFTYLNKELNKKYVGESQKIVLDYYFAESEEKVFKMTIDDARRGDWEAPESYRYSINSSKVLIENLRQNRRSATAGVGPVTMDMFLDGVPLLIEGRAISIGLSFEKRFLKLATKNGRVVILRYFYDRKNGGLNVGVASPK